MEQLFLEVLSQSLFSWIHLSYGKEPFLVLWRGRRSQSLFSWIHLSYQLSITYFLTPLLLSQSLFSWIHLSYKKEITFWLSVLLPSQSLFSWIHLSYATEGVIYEKILYFVSILIFLDSSFLSKKEELWRNFIFLLSLNPYFPGFIFLINFHFSFKNEY